MSPPTSVILNLAPEPDRMGVVRISGDVVEALARSSAGEWRLPGAVPVGTYTIMARFDGGPVELAGVLRVSADKTTTVRCVPETRSCAPARE